MVIVVTIVRLGVGLVLLFMILIGVVKFLAYNVAYFEDLQAFLQPPPNCPAPCFIGIRPGQTTHDEAVEILEKHPWAAHLQRPLEGSNWIGWDWSDQAPGFLERGMAKGNLLLHEDGSVSNVTTRTTIATLEIWHVFGQPDEFLPIPINNGFDYGVTFAAHYEDQQFLISGFLPCPHPEIAYWQASVSIQLCDADCIRPSSALPHPDAAGTRAELTALCDWLLLQPNSSANTP